MARHIALLASVAGPEQPGILKIIYLEHGWNGASLAAKRAGIPRRLAWSWLGLYKPEGDVSRLAARIGYITVWHCR